MTSSVSPAASRTPGGATVAGTSGRAQAALDRGCRPSLPMHSACDVAAIVYGPADDPDTCLRGFFERRLGQGHDVVGILQRRLAPRPGEHRRSTLRLAGETPRPDTEVTLPGRCDADLVAEMGRDLAEVLDRRPDVLVHNRFGLREAEGDGLFDLMFRAVERELPFLVAVPEGLFAPWLAASGGLAVRLAPTETSVERWWTGLGYGVAVARPMPRACEALK